MIATNEELALLEKWKRKLCLQEWRITLLNYESPVAYTVRREGWAADIYDMGGGVAIVTGYAPFGNIRPSYELRERYEKQAEKIRYDYNLSYEQQRESLKSLARDFIKGVCNHE